MPFVQWDESYTVGVAEIDAQHRKLFEMINRFYDRMREDAAGAQEELLRSLLDYVNVHFATEEKYFDEFHYPGAESHKAKHREFRDKFVDIRRRTAAGRVVVSMEITLYLRDWLVTHIRGTDQAYGAFFNAHGLR